ncbi:MAG: hypothetical protein P8104_11625, partial [Gammaproteobacteria bacterium]
MRHETSISARHFEHHAFGINQVANVFAEIGQKMFDNEWYVFMRRFANATFNPSGRVFPQNGVFFKHDLVGVFFQMLTDERGHVFRYFVGFQLVKKFFQGAEFGNDFIGQYGGHFLGFCWNNALPTNPGFDANELDGPEGHLDGQPVGEPTNETSQQWDAQKFE